MLKRAPSVYVPLQPEDDGIALPTVLSIVVHSAIVAFILFANRIPKIEIPPTIETSIVTPEELAQMEADVAANRKAMGSGDAVASSIFDDANLDGANDSNNSSADLADNNSQTNMSQTNDPSTTDSNAASKESTATKMKRRTVSIFTHSDEEPDTSGDIGTDVKSTTSDDIKQKIIRKREAYNAAQQEFQRQLEQDMEEELRLQQQALAAEEQARQERLKELHQKESHPPIVEKPKRVDKTFPPSISGNNDADSGSTQTVDITQQSSQTSDGDSTSTNNTVANKQGSGTSSGTSSSAGGGKSKGTIIGALVNHIKPYWHPPTGRVGKTVTAKVKVDENGNVLSVSANSDDAALNKSLEDAIRNASPLTPVIGTDFRYLEPTFKVKN